MRPVASAALGVAGFVGFGPIAWIPGLVIGHQALKSLPKNDDRRTMAVIGVSLAWLGVLLMVVLAFVFVGIAVGGSEPPNLR